jgi:hypothetical protein
MPMVIGFNNIMPQDTLPAGLRVKYNNNNIATYDAVTINIY